MVACAEQCTRISAKKFVLAALLVCCVHAHPAKAESTPFHLNIGFSSRAFISVPKEDIRIALQVLSRKVARKTVGSADSRIYDSTDDIKMDLKSKKVDVVALTPEEFIHIRTHTSLEPVMSTVNGKSPEIEMLLLVRKDSGLTSVADLKRRTIALPSKKSQYGGTYHTWLDILTMKERAASTGDFFSSVKETRNASQAALAAFFHHTDACIISNQAFDISSELNPQIARDMKVIARIGRLVGGVIAFRHDLPEDRKQKVRRALATLHEDQEGHQMFMLFQLNRLAPFLPENLTGIEALYAEHRNLKSKLVRK
jgi:ABC-type phosphate/phosphonate transport system substrate-binding protein